MAEYIHIYMKDKDAKEEIENEAKRLGLSTSAFVKTCYEFYKEEKLKRSTKNGSPLYKAEGGTL